MIANSINYSEIYDLFSSLTPLAADCGTVCGGACCRVSLPEAGESGMALFPREEAFLSPAGEPPFPGARIVRAAEGPVLLCAGRCPRERRPLSCRIFPLFPYLDARGRIRAVYDPRAWRLCPLVREHARVPLQRAFVRAVSAAGHQIVRTPQGRAFLLGQSREIDDFNRLLRLDAQRAPICRKSVVRS